MTYDVMSAIQKAQNMTSKRRNKYGAKRTTIDGETFDSQAEALWYQGLKARLRAGEIKDLKRQVKFDLYGATPEGAAVKVCTYIADAAYTVVKTGKTVIADKKGVVTPTFRIKAKLMLINHGIEVELT